MLNRKLGIHQWLALVVLFFGVVLVQLQQTTSKKPAVCLIVDKIILLNIKNFLLNLVWR